jgi:hypothetical protein
MKEQEKPLLSEVLRMDAAAVLVRQELERLEGSFLEACAHKQSDDPVAEGMSMAAKRARLGLVREFMKRWWGTAYNDGEDHGSGFDESNELL